MSEHKSEHRADMQPRPEERVSVKQRLACGILSTLILLFAALEIVPGILSALIDAPVKSLCASLLGDEIGSGGLSLLHEYAGFIGIFVGSLALMAVVKPWRPYLKALGTEAAGNRPSMLALGLLVGFLTNGVCVLVACLMGNIQIEFKRFSPIGIAAFIVVVFIQCATEELQARGFAYQRIKRTYNPRVAILASACFFMIAHVFNSGVTPLALLNIFVIGVFYALFVHCCDSIWLPIGAHTAWNFTQNILFGLPNSGNASTYSIFGLVGTSTDGFAFDTAFGVEGTVVALMVNSLCVVALLAWSRKHAKKELDIWEGEDAGATPDRVRFY